MKIISLLPALLDLVSVTCQTTQYMPDAQLEVAIYVHVLHVMNLKNVL